MENNLSNWKTRNLPDRIVFKGNYVCLEPLNSKKHGDDLYKVGFFKSYSFLFLKILNFL